MLMTSLVALSIVISCSACSSADLHTAPPPMRTPHGDALESCGRVVATGQQYSVATRVRHKQAQAALIVAGTAVAGTLATSIVGATTKDQAVTGVTGAGAIAAIGISAAIATFM